MEWLVGLSTLALAVFTAILARAAFLQIKQGNVNEQRRFDFEMFRLAQARAPIVVADFKIENRNVIGLSMRNAGTGPAINVRFSGSVTSSGAPGGAMEYTGAQRSVSSIGVGQEVLALPSQFLEKISELLIRYEDLFGNIYSTEYIRFERDSAWYVWRKPHLGKGFLERPADCSEDYPSWGFRSRIYYDALKGLW